jgi:hypothetical protein
MNETNATPVPLTMSVEGSASSDPSDTTSIVGDTTEEVGEAPSEPNRKKMFYKVQAGMVWNPMLGYPRNMKCFCGKTALKAKRCCIPKLMPAVTKEVADQLNRYMKQLGIK